MKYVWKLCWQTSILVVCYWICEGLVRLTGLPIPGNVLGIIVLFLLLSTGIIPENAINEAASFFLRHLVFFFVPIAAGLMEWGGVFYDYGWIFLAAIVISSLLPLLAVSFLARFLQEKKSCPNT